MLNTNRDRLVELSVIGEISNPPAAQPPYRVSASGKPVVLPGVGGISYNVRIGDRAVGWEADHMEPGVSIKNLQKKEGNRGANDGLNTFACIGNEAVVTSGEAKGERGTVTGKHGGIEHVLVDFAAEVKEKLVIGDKIQVKAFGVGLKLSDVDGVEVMNIAPDLLEQIPIQIVEGAVVFPVTHRIPATIMGSGLGAADCHRGDYDIQLFDKGIVEEYGLDDLRLGDFVAIVDADHTYGRIYRKGAVTVGVVVHSDCVTAGHGPGVTTVLTSGEGRIRPEIDAKANLVTYLGIE